MIINLYLLKLFIYFFQPQKKFKISVSKCNEIEQALATVTTRWSLANPYLMNLSGILHWHFWLVACLNDLVYSNTNSRQPCYISLSLKSAGIFQHHWPWVLCVYFTWCRIYVNQDEIFCYTTPFMSSLNKYLWDLGPNHLRYWRQISVKLET